MPPAAPEDLLIITRERIAFYDVAQHFSTTARVEIRLDRRHGERRRAPDASAGGERRRRDRRALHVDDELRRVGWVFVPAAHRGGDPHDAARSPEPEGQMSRGAAAQLVTAALLSGGLCLTCLAARTYLPTEHLAALCARRDRHLSLVSRAGAQCSGCGETTEVHSLL